MELMRRLARLSKLLVKYSYYPILVGAIAACSAVVYRGTLQGAFALLLAIICAALCALMLLKNRLCRMTGEDPEIK